MSAQQRSQKPDRQRMPLAEPIYERQPKEGDEAFQAFALYRDMEHRSHVAMGQKLGKSHQLMDRWSARWSWVERVNAWDRELDRQKLKALSKSRTEMAKRHAKQAVAIQFKAIERLAKLKPEELKAADVLNYFMQAARLERLSLGVPTDSIDNRVSGRVAFIEVPVDDLNEPSPGPDPVRE
jgi:hypothetical protein